MELALHTLQMLAHPERARILVHLAKRGYQAPLEISDGLEVPLSTVYRYLSELEAAGLVRSSSVDGTKRYRHVPFSYELSPESLQHALQRPVELPTVYRQTLGERRWARLMEVAEQAHKGKLTLRQAAKKAQMRYAEFLNLYDALGFLVENKTPPSRG